MMVFSLGPIIRLQGRQSIGEGTATPSSLSARGLRTLKSTPVLLSAAEKHENTSLLSSSRMHQTVSETPGLKAPEKRQNH